MKNVHQLITEISEYFIITAVLALPPLFVPQQTGAVLHVPSAGALLFYALASLFLYLRVRSTQNALSGHYAAARLLLCFCALTCSAVLWNRIASAAGESSLLENAAGAAAVCALLSDTPGGTFRFVSGIIVLACYEEMLYRFFLPEKARMIVSLVFSDPDSARISRMFYALAEFIPICLFALAHRYLGVYAVCNALCAAVILRTAFCKKVPIFGLCAVHAAYNAAMLIVLFNMAL